MYFYCKTKPRLKEFLIGKENMPLHKKFTILQGIFSYINERDPSSPDCKYKHMLENGAPPDKFGVQYRLIYLEFHGFNSRIDICITFWFLV